MKVRHYGHMAVLSMGCMLLLAPGIARAGELRGNQCRPRQSRPISSLQINGKGPGGMLINSVGANGLIPTDFDIVCSGN
jgi:hypothetical protein